MEVKQRTARILTQRLSTSITSATLSEIRLLSKNDPDIRLLFADIGLIPILTNLLLLLLSSQNPNQQQQQQQDQDQEDQEEDVLIQVNACATLLNLSITTPESLMSTPSLLTSLSAALRSPNPSLPPLAAATLYSLLTVDAYRPIIGSKLHIISSLIFLLTLKSTTTRSLKDSLKALFALALYPLNRPSIISLNAVPPLFALLLLSNRVGIMEDASAVIAQVAGCYESVEAFRKVEGVRVLVGMVGRSEGVISERVKENASSALLNLARSGGEKAVGDIREVEVAVEVVRGMAEKGRNERGRRKGEELLRVLEMVHQFYDDDDDDDDRFMNNNTTTTTDQSLMTTTSLPRCCSTDSSSLSSVGSSSY